MSRRNTSPQHGHNSGSKPPSRLKSFVERLERLEAEKKEIQDYIKDVKNEARASGYDVKTINAIIKLRKMTPDERQESEALLDIYKAELGMLFDTPLGESARRKLSGSTPQNDQPKQSDDQPQEANDPLADITEEQAREMGAEAAKEGIPVTENPFPARDKRRAAWDEAWCFASGSDGMDIPKAWQRQKPENPSKEDDSKKGE